MTPVPTDVATQTLYGGIVDAAAAVAGTPVGTRLVRRAGHRHAAATGRTGYGADGYDLAAAPASLPAYATVTTTAPTYVWSPPPPPTPAPC